MLLSELIKKSRCHRKFYQSLDIDYGILWDIVISLRYISSAKNLQPLKYIISTNREKNREIFPTLKWAGYLKDWNGPQEGEKPSAYIVILKDKDIADEAFVLTDAGIAIQTIMLSLSELELGGCTIAAMDKKKLRNVFSLPDNLEILYVIAVGKPKDNVKITEVKDSIEYFRDSYGNHYVPKRAIEDLLYRIYR